jgi:hypothetical protein
METAGMTDEAHGQSTRPDPQDYVLEWRFVAFGPDPNVYPWRRDVPKDGVDARIQLRRRPVPAPVGLERIRKAAQEYADFWSGQADKNDARAPHYEVIASQFQRLANLSPDHRTEPASAPIGQAEVKDDGR